MLRRGKWKVLLAAGMLALVGWACNGDDGDNGNGMADTGTPDAGCDVESTFALSGQAQVHPIAQGIAGGSQNLAGTEMRVLLATSALGGQLGATMRTGDCGEAVATTASDFGESSSMFNFEAGVEQPTQAFPVVGAIDDVDGFEPDATGDWVPTVSGFASPGDQGVPDTDMAQAFAMTSSAEAALAGLIGPEVDGISGDPGSLLAQGPAIVQFVNAQTGEPVEGVKFYTSSEAQSVIDEEGGEAYGTAYYPNENFTSVSVGADGSTASHGAVIVTGIEFNTTYTGLQLDGSGNVTAQFTQQQGGNAAGVFYAITLTQVSSGQ